MRSVVYLVIRLCLKEGRQFMLPVHGHLCGNEDECFCFLFGWFATIVNYSD